MNIETFEKQIDGRLILKGKAYYEDGCIIEMEEIDPGKWEGIVAGSDDYNVFVSLVKKKIVDCSCDCPHDVEFCKHLIAALFYIREVILLLDIGPVAATTEDKIKKKKKPSVDEALNQIPIKELQDFVKKYAKKNKGFRDLFSAHFAGYFGEENGKSYSRLLKNAARAAADRSGFIDYYHAREALEPAMQLVQNAEEALNQRHFSISTDIAFAVIEEVHDMVENMDDSSGYAGTCISESFSLLNRLLDLPIPGDLRNRIFEGALKAAQEKKYDFAGFDDEWLGLAIKAAYDKYKQDKALALVDKLLSGLNIISKEWSVEFDMVRLLKHKIRLLQNLGAHEDATKLRLHHLEYTELRISLIEECITLKDFDQAKKLCVDGISIAKKKKLAGTIDQFKELQLKIAQLQGDVDQVRAISLDLYEGHDMKYYRVLKGTYLPDEWPAIVFKLIDDLETSNKNFAHLDRSLNAENIAAIFIEESYWPQLVNLLQRNPQLHLLESFSQYLPNNYLSELVDAYYKAITQYLKENTGRNHYVFVRGILEKILQWKEGKEKVKKISSSLSTQFKARKALIEELCKLPA
ncbi:SWIM zinc finger family protein [Pseudobacter ginsenosidimutans]|nr:SWIM zinc finger family protein [Pseudobacter ginsenosidimutans]